MRARKRSRKDASGVGRAWQGFLLYLLCMTCSNESPAEPAMFRLLCEYGLGLCNSQLLGKRGTCDRTDEHAQNKVGPAPNEVRESYQLRRMRPDFLSLRLSKARIRFSNDTVNIKNMSSNKEKKVCEVAFCGSRMEKLRA